MSTMDKEKLIYLVQKCDQHGASLCGVFTTYDAAAKWARAQNDRVQGHLQRHRPYMVSDRPLNKAWADKGDDNDGG